MKLDELLPSYDVAARYEIVVQAPLADTAAVIENGNILESRLGNVLMTIRTLGRRRPDREAATNTERLQKAGFVLLQRVGQQEVVFGLVGRFWTITGGIVTGLSADEVMAFNSEGFAKAFWNFFLVAESERTTRVITETRVQAFGSSARLKFGMYWTVIAPSDRSVRFGATARHTGSIAAFTRREIDDNLQPVLPAALKARVKAESTVLIARTNDRHAGAHLVLHHDFLSLRGRHVGRKRHEKIARNTLLNGHARAGVLLISTEHWIHGQLRYPRYL